MDLSPPRSKLLYLSVDDEHGTPHLGARHSVGPNEGGGFACHAESDFRVTIAKHVHMGRHVIIQENDDPKTALWPYRHRSRS